MDVGAEHDVVILGAGPAGTAAGIQLAQMGLDVGIAEHRSFPRSHVGICISDETVAVISFLGLEHAFAEARFWRRTLTAVRWGYAETRLVPQQGYHVDRAILDQLMLDRSRSAGARVYQPFTVLKVEPLEGSGWRVAIGDGDRCQVLKARFLVDATGRRPALRGARVKDGPPLVALHASWRLAGTAEFDGLIEAGEDAWLWYAQTARDQAVISVFCDPRHLKVSKWGGLQARYSGLLRQFRALKLDQLGHQCSDPQACDATSQHAEDPLGERYIRLGDSCFSVDPLSSQGVHLALQSGLQGAVIVNTLLNKPGNTAAARGFFRTRVAERVARYAARTRQEYGRVSTTWPNAFWHERAGDTPVAETHRSDPPLELSPSRQLVVSADATFDAEPVIDGTFVEFRPVVRHPNIDGGIAYVEGADLVRLLAALPTRFSYSDIPMIWRDHVPLATGSRIASWLWNRRVLVQAT